VRGRFFQMLWVLVSLVAVAAIGSPVAQETSEEQNAAPADTIPPDLARARELMNNLEASLDSILVFEDKLKGKDREAQKVLNVQGRRYAEKLQEDQPKLLDIIPKLDPDGIPAEDIKRRFKEFLVAESDLYDRVYDKWSREIDNLRDLRTSAATEELGDIEAQINTSRDRLDDLLTAKINTLTTADSLGLTTGEEWDRLESLMTNRAENLVGRLQIAANERNQLQTKIRDAERAGAPEAQMAADRTRLQYANRRVEGIAKSLGRKVDLLAKRGVNVTQYRQFIIQTTGKVTEKVLDPRVLVGLVYDFLKNSWKWIKDNGAAFLVKLLIILAFIFSFRLVFRLGWRLVRLLGLAKLSRLMADLVNRMINPFANITGLFAGLWFLGVNPTTLLAGVGVLSVIIGLALQDSLSNLAAGFFILLTRPYDVDDIITVSGGVIGTVRAMGLANTTVVTFDNRRLLVPNRKIWGEVIENRSAEAVRRVEIKVRIGYAEDVDRALEIIRDLLTHNERVLSRPEPLIFVSDLANSWIEIDVRPWTRNADWWPLLTELPRLVRLRFAEEGIEIPIPQTEITMRSGEKKEPPQPPSD
jgi:small conductance mechanosensitive channel